MLPSLNRSTCRRLDLDSTCTATYLVSTYNWCKYNMLIKQRTSLVFTYHTSRSNRAACSGRFDTVCCCTVHTVTSAFLLTSNTCMHVGERTSPYLPVGTIICKQLRNQPFTLCLPKGRTFCSNDNSGNHSPGRDRQWPRRHRPWPRRHLLHQHYQNPTGLLNTSCRPS